MSPHSEYTPARSDRVLTTENEVKEAISQRSELKAQLRALLRLEQATYKKAGADPVEGELFDPEYIYIRGPSRGLGPHSESTESSKSRISVYKDPVGPSSLKRKANDEVDVRQAKKQQKASFQIAPSVGHQSEQEDGLALFDEGPAVNGGDPPELTIPDVERLKAPKERKIRKPTSRSGKDIDRIKTTHERSVLGDKQPSNGRTMSSRVEANNASKSKLVNIAKDSGTDVETQKPARSLGQPSMGPPVAPKPPVVAESAFNQMRNRNGKVLKDEKMQDAVNRKLRVKKAKEIRTIENGRRASRHAAPKLRRTALSKKRDSAKLLAQPKDENTLDWQRSFSTAPPKNTASKPMIAQIHKGENETMVSEKVGSIERKRTAEAGLTGSTAKIARESMVPFSNSRPASQKRVVAPTKNLTDHEAIFGKGSKPKKPDIQRIHVSKSNRPNRWPRLVAISEHAEDV